MIATTSAPTAGSSGRLTPTAGPLNRQAEDAAARLGRTLGEQTAPYQPPEQQEATLTQSLRAVTPPRLTEALTRFNEELEAELSADYRAQAAQAAPEQAAAPNELPEIPFDAINPAATENLASGRGATRSELKAEAYEAEARMRVLERAAIGYANSRLALQ